MIAIEKTAELRRLVASGVDRGLFIAEFPERKRKQCKMVRWWFHLIALFKCTNKDSVVLSSMNGGLLRKGPGLGRAQKDL